MSLSSYIFRKLSKEFFNRLSPLAAIACLFEPKTLHYSRSGRIVESP